MQAGARVVHIAYNRRGIQPIQYILQFPGMRGLNPLFRSTVEQLLDPLGPEAFDR
jgi:hypothetical protein